MFPALLAVSFTTDFDNKSPYNLDDKPFWFTVVSNNSNLVKSRKTHIIFIILQLSSLTANTEMKIRIIASFLLPEILSTTHLLSLY